MNQYLRKLNTFLKVNSKRSKAKTIFHKYSEFTMVPLNSYVDNLLLSNSVNSIDGCVVECGVWRGGMIAGIYDHLDKKRKCYLFDSFEGLPKAQENDGKAAKQWQKTNEGVGLDNCKAEMAYAEKAMQLANSAEHKLIKGWFNETLTKTKIDEPIAILRLDGDWYDSTMVCLENLYPLVADNGIIIVDDYYAWDGCARAVHDYLSKNNLPLRIRETKNNVCYIINSKEGRKI